MEHAIENISEKSNLPQKGGFKMAPPISIGIQDIKETPAIPPQFSNHESLFPAAASGLVQQGDAMEFGGSSPMMLGGFFYLVLSGVLANFRSPPNPLIAGVQPTAEPLTLCVNEYDGVVEAKFKGKQASFGIKVTYDGKNNDLGNSERLSIKFPLEIVEYAFNIFKRSREFKFRSRGERKLSICSAIKGLSWSGGS